MRHIQLLLLLLWLLAVVSDDTHAQPLIDWEVNAGGPTADVPRSGTRTLDMGVATFGYAKPTADEAQDMQFMRFNGAGILQNSRFYGGDGIDQGKAIVATVDGGFLAGGYTYSNTGGLSRQLVLLKLNGAGDIEWQQVVGQAGEDSAFDILLLDDNTAVVAGDTQADLDSPQQGWVMRWSLDGDLIWDQIVPSGGVARLFGVTQLRNGTFVAAGQTFVSPDNPIDAYLVCLQANGDIVWERHYGGEGIEILRRVRALPDGGFIAAGQTTSYSADGSQDILVLEGTADGDLTWTQVIGLDAGDDYARPLQITPYNQILVGGSLHTNANGDQYWLSLLDRRGKSIWTWVDGTGSIDVLQALVPMGLNNYVMVGETYSGGTGGTTWLARFRLSEYDAGGTAVEDAASDAGPVFSTQLLPPSPNPTNGTALIRLQLAAPGYTDIRLHDLLGRQVAVLQQGPLNAGEQLFTVPVDHLPSGRYMISARVVDGTTLVQPLTVVK